MTNKKSLFGCFPSIAILSTLLMSGYAYKQKWHQFFWGTTLTPIEAANIIPDETILTSYIYTENKKWSSLSTIGNSKINDLLKKNKQEIIKNLSEEYPNIKYSEDIAPWLGNAMVAVIPKTSSLETIKDPEILAVFGIENPLKGYQFLKKIKEETNNKFQESKYKGIKITGFTNSKGNTFNFAVLGNKIILSDDLTTVQKSIDTYRGESSLSNIPQYQNVYKQKLKIKNPLAKIYIHNYNSLLLTSINDRSSQTLANIQPVQSLVTGIGAKEKQIKLQTIINLKDDVTNYEYKPVSGKIINQLPDRTIAFINGRSIDRTWSSIVEMSHRDREMKQAVKGLKTTTRWVTGLDLDRDIFNWMDGEFALGIVNTQKSIPPQSNFNIGATFILETSDPDTAKNSLDRLDKALQTKLGLRSRKTSANTITQWSVPSTDMTLSSSWLDNNKLAFSFGNSMENSLSQKQKYSLTENSNFKLFAKELPKKNLGYIYFDIDRIISELNSLSILKNNTNTATLEILNSIQSIGATSTMLNGNKSIQTDGIILLK